MFIVCSLFVLLLFIINDFNEKFNFFFPLSFTLSSNSIIQQDWIFSVELSK